MQSAKIEEGAKEISHARDTYLQFRKEYDWNVVDMVKLDSVGRLPFHITVFYDKKRGIETLLRRGCNVNAPDGWGYTALHWAVDRSNLKLAQFLVNQHHASVNFPNLQGTTPLHKACESGNWIFTTFLLEKGAHTNDKDRWGRTALLIACQEGHSGIARHLLHYTPKETGNNTKKKFSHEKADVNNICIATDNTSMHLAAAGGLTDIVNLLIEGGASINQANKKGNTPLHVASEGPGYFNTVTLHLKKGTHTNTVTLLLKKGARTNDKDRLGLTALHMACRAGKSGIAKYLLHYTPKGIPDEKYVHEKADITLCTDQGFTALHYAAGYGRTDLTRFLIEVIGISVHATTKKNIMPLYLAAMGGHDDAIRVLIEHGAEVDFVVEDNTTPLSIAMKNNDKETVALLLREKLKDKLAALKENPQPQETPSTTKEIEGNDS